MSQYLQFLQSRHVQLINLSLLVLICMRAALLKPLRPRSSILDSSTHTKIYITYIQNTILITELLKQTSASTSRLTTNRPHLGIALFTVVPLETSLFTPMPLGAEDHWPSAQEQQSQE
jgi:hypothetical protein